VPTGTERERQSEAKPKTKRTVDGARLPKCPASKDFNQQVVMHGRHQIFARLVRKSKLQTAIVGRCNLVKADYSS